MLCRFIILAKLAVHDTPRRQFNGCSGSETMAGIEDDLPNGGTDPRSITPAIGATKSGLFLEVVHAEVCDVTERKR